MPPEDSQLIQHLLDTYKRSNDATMEMGKSLYQVHGVVSSVHERQEAFIQAHASHVRQMELRGEEMIDRFDDHSRRIDSTATKVAAWEAQLKLVIAVATFLGGSGVFAILAVLFKVYSTK
jgi:uncharacterized protein YukE